MYKILLLLYVVRLAEEKLYAIPVPASRGRPHRRGLQQTSSSAEPPQPRPRHPPGTELAATFFAGNCHLDLIVIYVLYIDSWTLALTALEKDSITLKIGEIQLSNNL